MSHDLLKQHNQDIGQSCAEARDSLGQTGGTTGGRASLVTRLSRASPRERQSGLGQKTHDNIYMQRTHACITHVQTIHAYVIHTELKNSCITHVQTTRKSKNSFSNFRALILNLLAMFACGYADTECGLFNAAQWTPRSRGYGRPYLPFPHSTSYHNSTSKFEIPYLNLSPRSGPCAPPTCTHANARAARRWLGRRAGS